MITNPTQFPTTSTISSGISDTDYDTEMTDIITTLTCTEEDFCKGYYLFSIPWESVPDIYKSSQYFSDPASFGVRPYTEPQNVGGFYMGWRRTSSPAALALVINSDYAIENNRIVLTPVTMLSYRPDLRFYNNFNIRKSANLFVQGRETTISAIRVDENGIVYRSYQTPDSASPSINNENFVAFLQGSISFDLTFSSWSKMSGGSSITDTLTLTLSKNDLENENQCKVIEQNGNTYYIGIIQYVIQSTRDNNMAGGVTDYTNHFTALVLHENNHKHLRVCQTGKLRSSDEVTWYEGYARILYDGSNYSGNGTADYTNVALPNIPNVIGTLDISVSKSDFSSRANGYFWKNTYTWAHRQDSNTLRIFRFYSPSEVIKHMMLCTRFCTTYDGASIAWNATQRVPKFDSTDTALNEWLIGSYYDYAAELRPWQDTFLKANEYTEQDIPPYVPPTPIDDRENIGDKITRPLTLGIGGTNGFVTLYAMRKSDIAQLGALLWTSFVDADYWKNYLFSLALDTGTFSLAGLLNFFVSCRVYPFSLINIAGCTSFGRNMYVGTGTVPLEFTAQTTLHVLTDMVDYISGGYCDVPRHFNDWRDYINTEIILYVPYCGTLRLNPGDVIGNRISVQYAIDFATGGCIAYVDMLTGDGAGYPVGALPGQIGADIPLTATAAGEIAARFIGDALNVGGIIADEAKSVGTGLAGAAAGDIKASGSAGSALSGMAAMMGGPMAAVAADMAIPMAKQGLTMLTRGAVAAPMLSGGRGFASFGAPQVPYIQIRRGIYPEITRYATVGGEPAAMTTAINALTGFIQGTVKADGLSCHQAEKEEIIALISSGIYV